jgi:hypothetical protein
MSAASNSRSGGVRRKKIAAALVKTGWQVYGHATF